MPSPARVFKDIPIDLEVCRADARCIYWVLDFTTDVDVIFSTVRFVADTIWHPEIARALSPHILADLFFDCLWNGRVMHGRSEHASSIGMALASVLSIRLSTGSGDEGLGELRERIESQVEWGHSSEPMFKSVVEVLKEVVRVPTRDERPMDWRHSDRIPRRLSTTQKLWLSRVILQTVWRWRCVKGPTGVFYVPGIEAICQTFTADGDQMPDILKTNIFLALAIALGVQIDIRDLYAPNDKCVTSQSSL